MDFKQLVHERISVREYQTLPVSRDLLFQVMEAGRMAPSAVNRQPWAFVVITNPELLELVKTAYPRDWFYKIPSLIVVCGNHERSWKRSSDGKDHCDVDVAIAVDHMTLRAVELGLGSCWVCNFDVEVVREALELPPYLEPVVLLPIGYPSVNLVTEKKRLPADKVMFENGLIQPFVT